MHHGIVCPECGCKHLLNPDGSVGDSKRWWVVKSFPHHQLIIRKRMCRFCGKRITTRERIETAEESEERDERLAKNRKKKDITEC